jgi:hypothetical protein
MPTELISLGPPTTLLQNVVYALPAAEAVLFTDTATPTLQLSNTLAFTNNVAITLTGGMASVGGGFIRCTSGTAVVTLKRD